MCISAGQNGTRLIKMAREEIGLQPRSKVALRHAQQDFDTNLQRFFFSLHFSRARENLDHQGTGVPATPPLQGLTSPLSASYMNQRLDEGRQIVQLCTQFLHLLESVACLDLIFLSEC